MIITLDGPAGSGKSTTARRLAERLNATYLDTGAMYRSVTLLAIEQGVEPTDADRLEQISSEISIDFIDVSGGQKVIVNGRDRTLDIRTQEVDRSVSVVSSHLKVREKMVSLQKVVAANQKKVVVEGRDIGSVVFPNAEYKFFLSADPSTRAHRRALQISGQGIEAEDVKREILRRDAIDSRREVSPLIVPKGAVVIDNSNLSLDETIEKILDSIL